MPFTVNERYSAVVFEIKGKFLGSIEGPAFKEKIDQLKEAGKKHIVVDLSRTDFMDSTGIGVLIASLTTMRKAGGDVRLAAIEKRIKAVILMTKLLGQVFVDYPTVQDAVQSYETSPPEATAADIEG